MQRRPPAFGWASPFHLGTVPRPHAAEAFVAAEGPRLAGGRGRVQTRRREPLHLTLIDPCTWTSVGEGPSGPTASFHPGTPGSPTGARAGRSGPPRRASSVSARLGPTAARVLDLARVRERHDRGQAVLP